jgi:hypothetical protein
MSVNVRSLEKALLRYEELDIAGGAASQEPDLLTGLLHPGR